MSQPINKIANRYLYCKNLRKAAAWQFRLGPGGYTFAENNVLDEKGNPLATNQAIKDAIRSINVNTAATDPFVRGLLQQYFLSKVYQDKEDHPEYNRFIEYVDGLNEAYKNIYDQTMLDPDMQAAVERAQGYSPEMARYSINKAVDEGVVDKYNRGMRPEDQITVEQIDPGLENINFSRYAPGMGIAAGAPLILGILSGNPLAGLLTGSLLAGGLGYYGYNRIKKGGKPTFIDNILNTTSVGSVPKAYQEYDKQLREYHASPEAQKEKFRNRPTLILPKPKPKPTTPPATPPKPAAPTTTTTKPTIPATPPTGSGASGVSPTTGTDGGALPPDTLSRFDSQRNPSFYA